MSKLYEFKVCPCGWGDSPEEAWESCKEAFNIDYETDLEYEIIDEDDENT